MQRAIKWGLRLTVALVALVAVGMGVVVVSPPDLLRVGTGYAAKIVCSNVFIAGRDAGEVLRDGVQAPGHPLLKLVGVGVDMEGGVAAARRSAHAVGRGAAVDLDAAVLRQAERAGHDAASHRRRLHGTGSSARR